MKFNRLMNMPLSMKHVCKSTTVEMRVDRSCTFFLICLRYTNRCARNVYHLFCSFFFVIQGDSSLSSSKKKKKKLQQQLQHPFELNRVRRIYVCNEYVHTLYRNAVNRYFCTKCRQQVDKWRRESVCTVHMFKCCSV